MSDTATATATTDRAADNELQFTLVGDTMLGRLVRSSHASLLLYVGVNGHDADSGADDCAQVDQFFPTHIETASEDSLHASFWKQRHADIAEK